LPVKVPRNVVGQVIVKSIKNIQDMDKRGEFLIRVNTDEQQPDMKV
jgi:predicted PilT family ATPase